MNKANTVEVVTELKVVDVTNMTPAELEAFLDGGVAAFNAAFAAAEATPPVHPAPRCVVCGGRGTRLRGTRSRPVRRRCMPCKGTGLYIPKGNN